MEDKKGDLLRCQLCPQDGTGYTSTSARYLRRHVEGVHLWLRKFQCQHCDYCASRKHHLKRHTLRKHTPGARAKNQGGYSNGEDILGCLACEFKGENEDDLQNHYQKVHGGINPSQKKTKLFPCCVCNEFTPKTREELLEHLSDCGGGSKIANKSKKKATSISSKAITTSRIVYSCEKCTYNALSRTHLLKHTNRSHENAREFSCTFCPYKATRNEHLARHIRCVHLKMKDHRCPSCSFRTARKDLFHKHLRSHFLDPKDVTSFGIEGLDPVLDSLQNSGVPGSLLGAITGSASDLTLD